MLDILKVWIYKYKQRYYSKNCKYILYNFNVSFNYLWLPTG